jgi:hypothetical protein
MNDSAGLPLKLMVVVISIFCWPFMPGSNIAFSETGGNGVNVKQAPVKYLGDGYFQVGLVKINSRKKTIAFPGSVNMREGAVEYILVHSNGKTHESIFTTKVKPEDLHIAALLLGVKPQYDLGPAERGAKVDEHAALVISVKWERNGPPAEYLLHELVALKKDPSAPTRKSLARLPWLYNGSMISEKSSFQAGISGSFISIIRDPEALMNYAGESRANDDIHAAASDKLPRKDHPVTFTINVLGGKLVGIQGRKDSALPDGD